MKIKIFLTILISVICSKLYSQINQGGSPLCYGEKYSTEINKLKNNQTEGVYIVEDIEKSIEKAKVKRLRENNSSFRHSYYYGKEVNVSLDFFDRALKLENENGDKLWLLNIKSKSSEGYQFIFDKFFLPEQCKLYFFNEERNMVLGAFTSENNREDNRFVTQFINGNSVFVELFVPNTIKQEDVEFSINKVVYIFDNIFSARRGPYSREDPGDCFINTVCPQGVFWGSEIKSVALILAKEEDNKYWGVATGALINKENNYLDTDYPFFLTANHVYQLDKPSNTYSDPKDWVFLFRHETMFCSQDGSEILREDNPTNSVVGANIISRDIRDDVLMRMKSDYLLLQLKNRVNQISKFDISFAGWNANEAGSGTFQTVGIHHPKGDVKKISISNTVPESSSYWYSGCPDDFSLADPTHLKVIWDEGVTAPGSSGSPLFNQDKQIIGLLSGGFSFCDNQSDECSSGPKAPDFYGKFSRAWKDGNLSQYLAPSGNVSFVASYTPKIDYNLPITIQTNPENVYLGKNFKVKAKSDKVDNEIMWYLWINKTPDDLNDYLYGSSNTYNENRITNNGEFESENTYNLTEPGTYKSKLYAYDKIGRQTTIIFSIVVGDKQDPCILAHFQMSEGVMQIEFPLNSELELSELASYKVPDCYTNWGSYPYDGVTAIKWYYDNYLIQSNTYKKSANNWVNQTDCYDLSPWYPVCINFEDIAQQYGIQSDGEHIIRMEVYAGVDVLVPGTSDIYNLEFNPNTYTSVTKKIKVVDCDKEVLIDSKEVLNSYNGVINGGNVLFYPNDPGNFVINSGEYHNVTAYNKIKFATGVKFNAGASFSAKILNCPQFNSNCGSSNSSQKSYKKDLLLTKKKKDGLINYKTDLVIYPNPTQSIFYINYGGDINNVNSIEIINSLGIIVEEKFPISNPVEFQLNGNPNGIYFIRVYFKDSKMEYRKLLLNK